MRKPTLKFGTRNAVPHPVQSVVVYLEPICSSSFLLNVYCFPTRCSKLFNRFLCVTISIMFLLIPSPLLLHRSQFVYQTIIGCLKLQCIDPASSASPFPFLTFICSCSPPFLSANLLLYLPAYLLFSTLLELLGLYGLPTFHYCLPPFLLPPLLLFHL